LGTRAARPGPWKDPSTSKNPVFLHVFRSLPYFSTSKNTAFLKRNYFNFAFVFSLVLTPFGIGSAQHLPSRFCTLWQSRLVRLLCCLCVPVYPDDAVPRIGWVCVRFAALSHGKTSPINARCVHVTCSEII
jgi:hypothetical protein